LSEETLFLDSPGFSILQENDEMLPEYDFTGGDRGKHYQAYRRGHTVTIHQTDGNDIVQYFTLEDGSQTETQVNI
jgi:hypothetical protein